MGTLLGYAITITLATVKTLLDLNDHIHQATMSAALTAAQLDALEKKVDLLFDMIQTNQELIKRRNKNDKPLGF